MKQHTHFPPKAQQGSIIVYILIAIITLAIIGSIAKQVTTQTRITSRQTHLTKAYQFADGGASIATLDLNNAFTLNANAIEVGLAGVVADPEDPSSVAIPTYTLDNTLSTADEYCYVRTIAADAPFKDQTISAQLWLKKDPSEGTARVVAEATSGGVSQTVTVHIMASYAFGAAVISTAEGGDSTQVSKSSAQNDGQLVFKGLREGQDDINGGTLSNGSTLTDSDLPDPDKVKEKLFGTNDEIPNYTDPGSAEQLFDFDQFIAVGREMTTHYTVEGFQQAMKDAYVNGPGYLEGIIVVDINPDDKDIMSYGAVPSIADGVLPPPAYAP